MPAAPTLLREVVEYTPSRKRFTREDVERMTEAGVFVGERYELIDGDLIDKMGQNPPHTYAIQLLLKWLSAIFEGDLIRIQHSMEAAPGDRERNLPEPDIAILRERTSELQRRHPRGDEMLLVIEVADTSVAFDLSRKAALYARSGVPEYWVLDLTRRQLVVHREPDGMQYRQIRIHSEAEEVSPADRMERVTVRDVLPAA